MLRRRGLSVSPLFLWECLTSRTVSPFPAAAHRVQKHKRTQDWRAGPFRSSSPRGEPQIWGVSEAMSAIRVLRTRRENTVQQRDATLPRANRWATPPAGLKLVRSGSYRDRRSKARWRKPCDTETCEMARTALIVGAGIGGLSAGIALRQVGWHVRILDHAASSRELGFGPLLASNAARMNK